MARVYLDQGGVPPQPGIPRGMTEEAQLLYAAWALGLHEGQQIQVKAVFGYIQSHIQAKKINPMQRCIENTARKPPLLWEPQGKGLYRLTGKGARAMADRFGQPECEKQVIDDGWLFGAKFGDHAYAVLAEPCFHEYVVYLDGKRKRKPAEAVTQLRKDGVDLPRSGSSTVIVMDWIIETKAYAWYRFPPEGGPGFLEQKVAALAR